MVSVGIERKDVSFVVKINESNSVEEGKVKSNLDIFNISE